MTTGSQQIAAALEAFLRQTHADQGGEAEFGEWLEYTLNDPIDSYHCEAVVLLRAKAGEYDLSEAPR